MTRQPRELDCLIRVRPDVSETLQRRPSQRPKRFNGTACVCTRRAAHRRLSLRTGRASTEPRANARGESDEYGLHTVGSDASTEPRANARGEQRRLRLVRIQMVGFNGAACECTRRDSRTPKSSGSPTRFNGAACECTRRGLTAEMWNAGAIASTEPRANARGESAPSVTSLERSDSFNGAACECTRRGPHDGRCRPGRERLQRSRVRMHAERCGTGTRRPISYRASTEPRANARGENAPVR